MTQRITPHFTNLIVPAALLLLLLVIATPAFAQPAGEQESQFGKATGADDPNKPRHIAGEEIFLLCTVVAIVGGGLILVARARAEPDESKLTPPPSAPASDSAPDSSPATPAPPATDG
ncbi:MAG: hypothetical protein AB7K09_15430 [Planctomycetota bacterium]